MQIPKPLDVKWLGISTFEGARIQRSNARLRAVRDSANLDLLRSFAVLCVFVCHLPFVIGRWDGIGTAGVILFFIHTSYVLLLSLQRNGDSWAGFQVRRIFRIYPLAIVAVISYLILKIPFTSVGQVYAFPHVGLKDVIASLFLVQNLVGAQSIPGVLWSLPYELQMYLVLPLVFLLCTRFGRKGAVLAYAAAAILIGTALVTLPPSPIKSLVFLLEFFPCFLAGSLLFTARTRPIFHWTGIFIVLAAVAGASAQRIFRNDLAQWAVCLAVATALPYFSEVSSATFRVIVKTIAKYSYGIYLSHYAAIQLALRITHNTAWIVAISLLLTAAFSFIAFHAIEQPFINMGKGIAARISTSRRPKASFATSGV